MTVFTENLASIRLYDDKVIGAGRLMRDDGEKKRDKSVHGTGEEKLGNKRKYTG